MNLKYALQILGLTEYSGPEDLKKAFRTQAHLYHPDKNPDKKSENESAHFRNLFEAYQYCLQNLEALSYHFELSPNANQPLDGSQIVKNLDDIFEDIFGFSRNGRILGYEEPQRIFLSLHDFFYGGLKKLKLNSYQTCSVCHGVGANQGTLARICRQCFGKGYFYRKIQKSNTHNSAATQNLSVDERKICLQCQGRGREIERPCQVCDGFGRVKQNHKQVVKIPAGLSPLGIYTLVSFDLTTQKECQVFVEIHAEHDATFQIDNYDLICEYHLDFSELHEDMVFLFETPLGQQKLVLPATAKAGDVLTLPQAGLYKDATQKEQGDLKIILRAQNKSLVKKWFRRFF